ncbi:MAG: peptide chain release factor N(5)-glutamine methyltransferase [Bacteroidetes bacterium]|nr:peptide chain release factor N(5)-glutamine methyltransferase [Bacteroidota bacterium]
MNSEERFNFLKVKLERELIIPKDKPDETVDATIKALWFASIGLPVSAEQAETLPLPELSELQVESLDKLLEQRLNNKPLAHITGRQNFMGIEMIADYRALIPRKETEILGRRALELSYQLAQQKHRVKVLDMGCGGGNLGLAIAYFNPNTEIYASDNSVEAIELTRENIAFLKLDDRFHTSLGDLFNPFESEEFYEQFDLIVCNPPYISTAMIPNLMSEISDHEPEQAFDGGTFGINLVKRLITESPRFLTRPGWLIFEIGVGQGPFMKQMCKNINRFYQVESVNDSNGIMRAILARKQ